MSPRTRPIAAVALVLAVLLAACSATGSGGSAAPTTDGPGTTATDGRDPGDADPTAPDDPTPDTGDGGTIAWEDCDGGYQCADVEVPVDYDEPDGETLTIGVARRPADDPDQRIGALFMNPGGPGGSAVELIESIPLPSELTDRFDIVGYDPRGVGRSTALDCHSHLQEIYDADPTMEDQADRDTYLEVSQEFVDECEQKYAELLPHLGTVNVARDMDSVREAMGEDQVSYVGYSYGTSIGQQYARLFPERVRAMVIDGVVDTSQTGLEAAAGQAKGFDRALDAFIEACDTEGCGLDGPAGATIDQVIAKSEQAPILASDRPATPGVVGLALGQALYSEFLWPDLADALSDGLAGDGDGLVALADQYLGREGDEYDGGFEIYFAVSCLDSEWPKDPTEVFAFAKEVGAQYPRVGEALVNDYARCALWPAAPEPLEQVPAGIEGLAPIVVISTTGDPATPYESGVKVAEEIPGAVLITNVGEGHTIFANGKACIDDTVTDYLVDLTVPEDGLRCE